MALTKKEKELRRKAKKELQEEGILPPDKKPLNRKKFAMEVLVEYDTWKNEINLTDINFLLEGIACILPHLRETKITEEHIGALKIAKIAMEYKKFVTTKREAGDTTYKMAELWAKIEPIIKL